MMKRILLSVLLLVFLTSPVFAVVPDSTSKSIQNCNGSATSFPFTFGVGATSEVKVTQTTSAGVSSVLLETTNYSVSCTNNNCSAGGSVITVATCPSGSTITLERNVPYTQDADFTEGMPTLYETFESGLDKLTRIAQQQRALIGDIQTTLAGTTLDPSPRYYHLVSDYDSITDAISDIGGANATLLCDSPVSLGANTTITSNIEFIATKGCVISVGAFTLTGLKEATPEMFTTNTTPGTTDMTTAIQAAIDAVKANHGKVVFQPDLYLATSPILAENIMGITLKGYRAQIGTYGTRIKGAHTGKAIVSLVGSHFCTLDGIELEGDSTSIPQTGLLLGRSSAASAGQHKFYGFKVYGTFSVSGYYNVASEDNEHYGTFISVSSPIAAVHLSQSDDDSIGGLTGSSMEKEKWLGGVIDNTNTTATSTALRIFAGSSTGHIVFDGTMIGKTGGDSFVELKIDTDGQPTTMPITLNIFGESGATNPDNGIHFKTQSASSQYISGLNINARFQSVDNYLLFDNNGTAGTPTTGYTQFVGANINLPYYDTGKKPITLNRVDKSTLHLEGANTETITITTAYDSDIYAYGIPVITTNLNNRINGSAYTTVMNGGFSLPCLAITNVSFAADGSTVIYTVPTGRRLVLSHIIVVAGADAGGTTVAIEGVGANDFLSAQTLSNLDAQYDAVILMPVPNSTPAKIKSYAAGQAIYATVGSHAGGATNTFYLFGLLY